MSYTLKISNGDLDLNEGTGNFNKISGPEKLAQDVAECLSTAYDPTIDYGNEIFNYDLPPSTSVAVGEVNRMVSDSINRLKAIQSRQKNLSYDEKMSHIGRLVVIPDQLGSIFFYVSVIAADGTAIEKLMSTGKGMTPTKLDQMFPSAISNLF